MLCETCIGVLQHRRRVIKTQTCEQSSDDDMCRYYVNCGHHLTCKSLVTAVANGCPICQPTWESLSVSQQDSLRALESNDNIDAITHGQPSDFITTAELSSQLFRDDFDLMITYSARRLPELLWIFPRFSLEKQRDSSLSCHPTIHASYQATNTYVQHAASTKGNYTTDDTSSAASLQMAGMWLRDCIQTHQHCNAYQGDNPWYPTRLLCLADSHGNEDYIRLIRTAEKSPNGPYATLSHRWGNSRPLQLTRSIASNPNCCFSMGDMPKTFQDAIKVSRTLGIQYLWIDSLCIIQEGDNLHDWYHEASLMDQVYTHSHLNIFAADAVDSTKGLFRHHPPLPLGYPSATVDLEGIEPGSGLTDCLLIDPELWSRNVEKSPLNKRGWVLQERYLAPRVLYFCRNQLFWECKEHFACETVPDGIPDLPGIKSSEKRIQSNPSDESHMGWIFNWDHRIVYEYSRMDLTVPSDKLIALSGIAKFFNTHLNDTYVAGMWRSRIESELPWCVLRTDLQPRPLVYRAPSWSWASVDGAIELLYPVLYDIQPRIQVVDVVLSHATEDTMGAVTGGWLDLRGVLKPLRLCKRKQSDIMPLMVLDNGIVSPQNDTVEESACMMANLQLDFLPDSHYFRYDDNVEGRLFYMPFGPPSKYSGSESSMDCLLLKLVDKDRTLFERCGIFSTSELAVREQLLADLDENTKAHLPCLRYENGLHTVRII